MKSIKLSKEKRHNLISHTVKSSFKKEEEKLTSLKREFINNAYSAIFTKSEQDRMYSDPNMQKVYDMRQNLYLYLNGKYCPTYLMGTFTEKKPFWHDYSAKNKFTKESKITKQFNTLSQKVDKLRNTKNSLRHELKTIINECTTTKQLLEVWPECKQFLISSGICDKPQAPVPMKPTDTLNKLLCKQLGKRNPVCNGENSK